jgi:hypothetical protein
MVLLGELRLSLYLTTFYFFRGEYLRVLAPVSTRYCYLFVLLVFFRGEYWRVLSPGRYKIKAVGNGKAGSSPILILSGKLTL